MYTYVTHLHTRTRYYTQVSGEGWGDGTVNGDGVWGENGYADDSLAARNGQNLAGKQDEQEGPLPFDFAARCASSLCVCVCACVACVCIYVHVNIQVSYLCVIWLLGVFLVHLCMYARMHACM